MKKLYGKIKTLILEKILQMILKHFTRIDVIDSTTPVNAAKRVYSKYLSGQEHITCMVQDNRKTLKIVIQ